MMKAKNDLLSVDYKPRGAEKLYYLSRRFHSSGHKKLAAIVKRLNQVLYHVNIYPEVDIAEGLQLPHGGFGVVIHHDTVIGLDAIIFHNVTIANGGACIGDRVYIGTGATLIGAVTIGNDVVIGANAVVNFNVPDNSLVVGPKGTIKDRS